MTDHQGVAMLAWCLDLMHVLATIIANSSKLESASAVFTLRLFTEWRILDRSELLSVDDCRQFKTWELVLMQRMHK